MLDTAKEILDYCIDYLNSEFPKNNKEKKLYKEMLKEIAFMIDTNW